MRYPTRPSTRPVSSRLAVSALAFGVLLAVWAAPVATAAETAGRPVFHTNEALNLELASRSSLDMENTMSVFDFVFGELAPDVKVFPTENYYYFSFTNNGVKYAGNLRLDTIGRDKGEIEFVYFKAVSAPWVPLPKEYHLTLSAKDGVSVGKQDDLVYRVGYKDKQVVFHLNDLRNVVPPEGALKAQEDYLGPVFDESGVQFYLVLDKKLKMFHYVLNEEAPATEEFLKLEGLDHLLFGRRSGFVFVQDENPKRKIMVAVYRPNVAVNNYFDGPFDQLPDNFFKGDELRRAIMLVMPDIDVELDRFGSTLDGVNRVLITPYADYVVPEDLGFIEECSKANKTSDALFNCIRKGVFEKADREDGGNDDAGGGSGGDSGDGGAGKKE